MKMREKSSYFCLSFLMILLNYNRVIAFNFKPYLTIPHSVSEADEHLIVILELKNPAVSCKLTSSNPNDIPALGDGVDSTISTNLSPQQLAEAAKLFDLQLRRELVLPIINDNIPEEDKFVTITAECSFKNFIEKASKRVYLKDDDKFSYTSPLTLELCISNVFYRDSPNFLKIVGLTGSGNCRVKSSQPSFFDINPKTFSPRAGTEHVFFYKFKNPKNNVRKNIDLIFDCDEENDGKKLHFVERVTAINRKIRKSSEFAPVVCSPLILCEGDEINLSVLHLDGEGKCKIDLSPNRGVTVDGKKQITLLPEVMRFFTVQSAKGTLRTREEVVKATIKCKGLSGWTTSERCIIVRNEKDCYGEGDPHFQQMVFNHEKNGFSSLCYDVTGRPGDAIFILREENPTDVSIYGILLDDYYMHKIRIVFAWETVDIGVNGIKFTNSSSLDWQNSEIILNATQSIYRLKISENRIEVYGKFNKFKKIIIDKVYKNPVGFHLNVHFEGLNEDFKGLKGLLGTIGNNHFQFFLPVQKEHSRGAAIVNGKYFVADLESRQMNRCWYMNVKNALYPHLLSDFVFKLN